MSTWRYVQNGQPSAPVDTAALRSMITQGVISPDSYVWQEGMPNWLAAKNLPEFANCRPPTVPPVPPTPPPAAPPQAVPPPVTPANDAQDIEKNRVFAILAYLWVLFLVGMVAAPDSKFAKYHSNQGLVLFLASLVALVSCVVIGFIPFVNVVLGLLMPLLWLGWLVLVVLGIVNAAGGQCRPLPLIGHFDLIK